MKTHWGNLVLGVVLVCSAPAMASDPVIDGLFDGASVYDVGFEVSFVLDPATTPGSPVPGGQIWFHTATNGDVSVAFIQPLNLVDNSYGKNAIGWGSKGHKLKDLQNSDKAQFAFSDKNGNVALDLTLEYGKRTSDGTKEGNPLFSTIIKTINPNDTSLVLAHESSLGSNYQKFKVSNPEFFDPVKQAFSPATTSGNTTYDVVDSNNAAWEFAVIYEFKIDGSKLFGPAGLNLNPGSQFGIALPTVHDSPNKFKAAGAKNATTPIIGNLIQGNPSGVGVVPEPSSLALLGLGSLGLLGYRYRRRRTALVQED